MKQKKTYTPRTLAKAMEAFIAHCAENDVDATDYQLIRYLGISAETLDRYRADTGDDEAPGGYGESFRRLALFREDDAIRLLRAEPRLASHVSLRLRQRNWGSWAEKGDEARDVSINVRIDSGMPDPFD